MSILKPNIYFISSGTSSNELHKSGKDILSYFGYKQLCKLRENNFFKNNILSNNNIKILTSADENCVVSSLVLFSDPTTKTVHVVPYLSNNREKYSNYEYFFTQQISVQHNSHYLESLNFGKNDSLKDLVKYLPKIDADYIKNGKIYKFDLSNFISMIEKEIKFFPTRNIVVICHSSIIRKILKKLLPLKYRYIEKRKESFENSSVWELKYDYDNILQKITYQLISKKYPIATSFKPLKFESGKYLFEFKGYDIPLFEKSSNISSNLLKKISPLVSKSNSKKNKNNSENKSFFNENNYTNKSVSEGKNLHSLISGHVTQ